MTLAELRRRSDFLTVLEIPAGRRVLLEILEKCNVFGPSIAEDAHQTAFNEGVRQPGIWLIRSIEAACPGEAGRLITEQYLNKAKRDENGRTNDYE